MESTFFRGTGRVPWRHQIEAVDCILHALSDDGRRNLLVQHATGSGKSATMALLVHQLAEQAQSDPRKKGFALILLLSDRLQLDRQLGDTLETFLSRCGSNGTTSSGRARLRRCETRTGQLMKVLSSLGHQSERSAKPLVVVTTKQKLDRILSDGKHHLDLSPIFACGRVAVICEECHRAHFEGGKTAEAVRMLFGGGRSTQPEDLVYIGFTGTPSPSCLRLFGASLHGYHLGEAEAEGVVLDVLANYETCRLQSLSEKCRYILADLQSVAQSYDEAFATDMKAMVVCRRRVDVVSYVQQLRTLAETMDGWLPGLGRSPGFFLNRGICGFFSGAVGDLLEERLNGLPLLEACRSARILVVCNKLETGFDEPRLAATYLDRCLESDVKMVQVLSRINRPLPGKGSVYVRDFHDQRAAVRLAFDRFRQIVVGRPRPGRRFRRGRRRDRVWCLQRIAEHDDQLEQILQTPVPPEKIVQLTETHQRLRKELPLVGGSRLMSLLKATRRLALEVGSSPAAGSRIVFVDQKVASSLLRRIIPSSRYGGARRRQKVGHVTAHLQDSLEATFRDAMAKPPAVLHLSQDSRVLLRADDGTGVEATLCGSPEQLEDFWKAVAIHESFFEVLPSQRKANTEIPYPVFICSKGRASSGFLNWRAEHCLGSDSSGTPEVIVVEPQEEAIYRSHWPQALLLVLPRPGETAIGYARWVVQKICTGSTGADRHLRLPFIWMADDLLLSFYRLEAVKLCQDTARTRIMRALPRKGFREAFLAIQQREDICDISISGFLRDRGASVLVKNDWMMDGSLALQKVVLLNLVRLQELGIAYCPVLRKSEDLAICYEVAQTPGGHLLKCQSYAYRARHLERGGAEEVRRECRVAARLYGGAAGDVRRLVLGGEEAMRKLPETQKSVLRALLSWLAASLRSISSFGSVDGHGDWNDGATEVAVPGEGEVQSAKKRGFMDWLSKLPKLPAEAAVSTVEQCPTVSDETPKAEGPARAVPLEPVAARPKRFLDFLGRSPSQKPQSKFLDFLKRSEKGE